MPTNTLLLTATITPPPGVPLLRRTDPHQRMDDYRQALDFYCRLPSHAIHRIIFIENSGTDLAPLRQTAMDAGAGNRVEFIGFNGLDYPPVYGRAFGEFKLIDHAMDHSRTLNELMDNDRIWKVTGRYRVMNLLSLIRTAPADFDLYCDVRDRPMAWIDFRVFACTRPGYRKLLYGIYLTLREDVLSMSAEHHFRPTIAEMARSHAVVTRFRREPRVDGIRGMDLQNYSGGLNRLKYWVRALGRRVPWAVPF